MTPRSLSACISSGRPSRCSLLASSSRPAFLIRAPNEPTRAQTQQIRVRVPQVSLRGLRDRLGHVPARTPSASCSAAYHAASWALHDVPELRLSLRPVHGRVDAAVTRLQSAPSTAAEERSAAPTDPRTASRHVPSLSPPRLPSPRSLPLVQREIGEGACV